MAGYIDGDGHFSIRKRFNTRGYPFREGSISICSTKEDIIKSFQQTFGGHIRVNMPKNANWANQYIWSIRGKPALDVAKSIFPYVKEKESECKIFIDFLSCDFIDFGETLLEEFKKARENILVTTLDHITYIRSIREKKSCSEEDFSYLAGYIDAECSIGISKFMKKDRDFPSYKIRVSMGAVCPIVPVWIMERFQGSASFRDKSSKNPNDRNQIQLTINSTDSFNIIKNILPFIQTKRAVCEKILEFKKTMLPRGYSRLKSFRQDLDTIHKLRESLLSDIHILNSKGSSAKRVVISATSAVSSI